MENQTFDRKSAKKDPKSLSNHMLAFANADCGTLVIGFEDDGTITGIDGYLDSTGTFVTIPEYPEFAWKELVINAVAHRDYSIKGTDIQIKMFDDRITVESPGTLPGIVRLNNIRQVHFSRNPKIAEFLHEYDYVKEFGEGVDRMFNEMKKAGLPAPEYVDNVFMLNATIRNGEVNGEINGEINFDEFNKNELRIYEFFIANPNAT